MSRITAAIKKFGYVLEFCSESEFGISAHYLTSPILGGERMDAEIYSLPQTVSFSRGEREFLREKVRGLILGYGIDGANWTEGETVKRKKISIDLADLLLKWPDKKIK